MIWKDISTYDISVLGGGPAGLTAALAAAKTARTLLILKRPPYCTQQFRIDAVPARTLALLVELGIDPQTIGVERLNTCRGDYWAASLPQRRQCAPTAHIERMRLEKALYDRVRASDRIQIIIANEALKFDGEFLGVGWRSRVLIDATGRRSITSQTRTRLLPVWGSCFLWTSRDNASEASPEFRIAALPCGYAYRLGSADRIGIGLVGRSETARPGLHRCNGPCPATLLLSAMPRLREIHCPRSRCVLCRRSKYNRTVRGARSSTFGKFIQTLDLLTRTDSPMPV